MAGQLAVQYAFQPPEHALDTPARAVQLGNPSGADLPGQAVGLPRFGGRLVDLLRLRDHASGLGVIVAPFVGDWRTVAEA